MGITSLIAAGGAQPDIAGTIQGAFRKKREREEQSRQIGRQETQDARAEEDRQLNREAKELSIKSANIDLLDDRRAKQFDDISEYTNTVPPILDAAIESGDTTALESSLVRRLGKLQDRKDAGEEVNLDETTEALALVKAGDLDGLSQIVSETNRVSDFRRAQKTSGGSLPAALQVANAMGEARASGDFQKLNDIIAAGKTGIKGQVETPQGAIAPQAGAVETVGEFAEAEGAGKERGKLQEQLKLAPEVKSAVKIAEIVAAEKGEALTALNRQLAQFPRLEEVTNKLEGLAQTATFTKAGQARDSALRQAGLPVGEGATARADFIATIDNEILPLLRETFGAAFTENEGKTLKATLGDPDLSPEEKIVVLKAFINQKAGKIETLERRLGKDTQDTSGETISLEDFLNE